MIIKISQTSSNIKQTYDIDGEGFFYYGNVGSFSRFEDITITGNDTTVKATYTVPSAENLIPFRYVFGNAKLTRCFALYRNDEKYGSFVYSHHGFFKSCYMISLVRDEVFNCYFRSKGSFDYVSIYRDDVQIALVETYLCVNDNKYTHKLYILDEHKELAETLSLFVLYYANYTFTQRFHMSYDSSTSSKSWSISRYNNKYDPTWRETHFPSENFFGKML